MHRFFFMGFVDGPLPTFSCYKTQKYTTFQFVLRHKVLLVPNRQMQSFIFFGNDRGGRRRPPAQFTRTIGTLLSEKQSFFFKVLVLLKIVVGQCTQNLKFKKL